MPDTMVTDWNPPSLEGRVSDAEWETRVDLAAAFRVAYHFGWNDTILLCRRAIRSCTGWR